MPALDALESALRIAFDRDTLMVYADELQRIGDPRGELVALDLHADVAGETDELAAERQRRIAAWLGGAARPHGAIRYGFIDVDATSATPWEQLEVALGGPLARWVRGATVVGAPETIARAVAQIAAAERPWLARVSLRQWPGRETTAIAGGAWRDFVAATPALHAFEVDGAGVIGDGSHPRVKQVRVSGCEAVHSLTDGAAWRAVTAVDFAMQYHLGGDKQPTPQRLADVLAAKSLPALAELDLSRNEPGRMDPSSLGGVWNVYELLGALDAKLVARLERVRLPTMQSGDLARLSDAVQRMPALVAIAIRRGEGDRETPPAVRGGRATVSWTA